MKKRLPVIALTGSTTPFAKQRIALAVTLALGLGITACNNDKHDNPPSPNPPPVNQPKIGARVKAIINVNGLQFKDANANGRLDPYEDWRLPVDQRAEDLVAQMTLEEKAGLMLIDTLNAGFGGTVEDPVNDYINNPKYRTKFSKPSENWGGGG